MSRFSGVKKYMRQQERQAAQARAGQVGEIDAAENPLRLQEDDAEEERAGQERQQVEQEVGEQPPFLRRVGDQEDGVERHLLRDEVGATVSGPNSSSEVSAAPCQWRSNQPLPTHMTALVRPKPSIARLTTSEPKCAQLPTAKTRMMPICSAMIAPATSPTDR